MVAETVEGRVVLKGYEHKSDNEFVFGVDDIQEIYDFLPGIYAKDIRLAIRRSGVKRKNAIIREELEKCLGRPIADTDKDFSGRTPYWGDKYLAGGIKSRLPEVQDEVKPKLMDITADCKPENRRSKSGGMYIRQVYYPRDYPHTEALAAVFGFNTCHAEKGFVLTGIGTISCRIYRDLNYWPLREGYKEASRS